jgi:hypothetical protein
MPYVNKPRPYAHEYQLQKKRNEEPARAERQRARRAYDKKGINRKGKDIAHRVALIDGGSNAMGTQLESEHANRSYARKSDHKPKSRTDSHFTPTKKY